MGKNLFIKSGELNFKGQGGLASIEDLNFNICRGDKEIKGLLQTSDGTYLWCDNTDNKESVEDVGEILEYVLISKEVPILYVEFMKEIDEDLQEILKCKLENDSLVAIVQDKKQQWIYTYNIWKDSEGVIQKAQTMLHKNMLLDLFEVA